MATALTLFANNDVVIEVDRLQNIQTGAFVNDATVTATVEDEAGSVLATVSLVYVTSSNGRYQGVLPYNTALVVGQAYTLHIIAVAADGTHADWRERIYAAARR